MFDKATEFHSLDMQDKCKILKFVSSQLGHPSLTAELEQELYSLPEDLRDIATDYLSYALKTIRP